MTEQFNSERTGDRPAAIEPPSIRHTHAAAASSSDPPGLTAVDATLVRPSATAPSGWCLTQARLENQPRTITVRLPPSRLAATADRKPDTTDVIKTNARIAEGRRLAQRAV
jgi:hypothetical protein